MPFIELTKLEESIVTELETLIATRKIKPFANPGDYDLTNIPANGLGFVYVSISNATSDAQSVNKKFGPIITRPTLNVNIKLVQRGNFSHKLCYPTVERIISLLHGFEYQQNRLIFDNFSYSKQDAQDKCWQYDMNFKYSFDFLGESGCC